MGLKIYSQLNTKRLWDSLSQINIFESVDINSQRKKLLNSNVIRLIEEYWVFIFRLTELDLFFFASLIMKFTNDNQVQGDTAKYKRRNRP